MQLLHWNHGWLWKVKVVEPSSNKSLYWYGAVFVKDWVTALQKGFHQSVSVICSDHQHAAVLQHYCRWYLSIDRDIINKLLLTKKIYFSNFNVSFICVIVDSCIHICLEVTELTNFAAVNVDIVIFYYRTQKQHHLRLEMTKKSIQLEALKRIFERKWQECTFFPSRNLGTNFNFDHQHFAAIK